MLFFYIKKFFWITCKKFLGISFRLYYYDSVIKQNQKVTIFAGSEDGTFKGIITGEPQVYSHSATGEFLDTAINSNQKDLVEELV